jgi:hypothetical protein
MIYIFYEFMADVTIDQDKLLEKFLWCFYMTGMLEIVIR